MGGSGPAGKEQDSDGRLKSIKKRKGADENKAGDDSLFSKKERSQRKPEGMSRELFALLASDNKDSAALISSDFSPASSVLGGYKQVKAKLGLKKPRAWKWMPFTNSGRTDGFMLNHWRRIVDEGKEYPFARFATVGIQKFISEYVFNLIFKYCRKFLCHPITMLNISSICMLTTGQKTKLIICSPCAGDMIYDS